ncbi:MAG: DUF4238 domain-containing protein [Gammaproteobacteria bacterium]|nr:DUF4238 domain-containing protein [Gammaproteobacteria bacterium]
MPLDHYISQVHLKNFYSSELGERMYAIRKADQKSFTTNAQSVCRIESGSTNTYLRDERIIEEFLKEIEPRYNASVAKALELNFDCENIYVIAGFVAYVLTCSPAAMRIHSELFRGSVEESARALDKQGQFPPPPEELGGSSLTELMEEGKISIEIDEKYPQAYGIASILSHVATFGNSAWEVLVNPFSDSPFFTSDYPIAIESSGNPMVLNRVVPLTPMLAIRIIPDIHLDRANPDYGFRRFTYKRKQLSRSEVRGLNQLFVRCAESLVFLSRMESWAPRFVERNSGFRIEPAMHRIPHEENTLLWFTQEVAPVGRSIVA